MLSDADQDTRKPSDCQVCNVLSVLLSKHALTAGAQDVENGIHDLAHIQFEWTTWAGTCQAQQWLQAFPLNVSQIAGINRFAVRQCNPLFGSLGLA